MNQRERIDLTRPAPPIRLLTVETEKAEYQLDLNKMAFVIIDMQNHFLHEKGSNFLKGRDISRAQSLVEPINELIHEFRKQRVPIIWVNWGNRRDLANVPGAVMASSVHGTTPALDCDARDERGARIYAPTEGSWDAQVYDALDYQPNHDIWVNKYRLSGFSGGSVLEDILKTQGKKTLFICGVNTDQCVATTLADANFLGFDCILVEDCCSTTSPSYCSDAAKWNVETCFGFILNSKNILNSLRAV
eukprot:TRINITY_DN3011_c0_g1_i1.p1 TRINITY_DN3011_c0_g1~~TRINITY_DN3011_c0_g1_i1.p1  ORF type:complete len:284 (-),score=56.09 TRINITY_DN3011_c0_g1_i1:36-776(-)